MKTVTHKLNAGSAVMLADNTYDDLGRLKKNSRNGVSSLSDTYEYNVRSWLTEISGAQHTEDLTYNYNGNISSMQWRLDGTTRKYAYSYDPLSRLVSTTFSGGKDAERYSTSYSYDKHGNILSLQRYGKTANSDLDVYGLADNLTMTYNGNQLTNVSDAAVTVTLPESNDFKKGSAANPGYAYDKNGNLMKDLNKKITAISYNSLYLPELLTIDGVTHKYTYAADGRKLKVVQGSTNRNYVGNIIYENGSLKRILVDGGYIEGGTYYFYFNDHLGNVRAVIDMNNYHIQYNHYYPFGLPMAETSDGKQDEQPYKYNGKEFERKNGLNWMDYGARMYDTALGRFTTMDPLAEKYYGWSPYAYCRSNPILRRDPNGEWDVTVHVYNNRDVFGYGFLNVVDRQGNIVYSTTVRVEGSNDAKNGYNKRDRTKTYADTPTGQYNIKGWSDRLPNLNEAAYGPNDVLELDYISGEAAGLRNGIHLHGGRQEGKGGKGKGSTLKITQGCLRIYDEDIAKMKEITDLLEQNDAEEKGNIFNVVDDLQRISTGPHPRPYSYSENDNDSNEDTSVWDMLNTYSQRNPNIVVTSK